MSGDMNPGNLLKQYKQIQEQLKHTQKELESELITAEVRGGAIRVTVTGTQSVHAIVIDPDFKEKADVEELQDLLQKALNQAMEKARKLALNKLGPLGGGIPGLR